MKRSCLAREPPGVSKDETLKIHLLSEDVHSLYRGFLVLIQPEVPIVPPSCVTIVPVDVFPRPIEQPEYMFIDPDGEHTRLTKDSFAGQQK